jgi:Protein of unknown function (DUF3551)
MRALLLAALAVAVAGTMSTGAEAQSNAWCAYFTGGPVNCEFATLKECMDAIRGKTALCNENAQADQPSGAQPKAQHHRQRQN